MPDCRNLRNIDFPDEGFLFLCSEAGLKVHVTDYHAAPLKLSWETINRWRIDATQAQMALPLEGLPPWPAT